MNKLSTISDATFFSVGEAGAMPEGGTPMSPKWQASFERQAAVLERDLHKYGLDLPASGKLSIATVDAALKDVPTRKRMEFKSQLHQFGVIP